MYTEFVFFTKMVKKGSKLQLKWSNLMMDQKLKQLIYRNILKINEISSIALVVQTLYPQQNGIVERMRGNLNTFYLNIKMSILSNM